jgi:hypothetical protein
VTRLVRRGKAQKRRVTRTDGTVPTSTGTSADRARSPPAIPTEVRCVDSDERRGTDCEVATGYGRASTPIRAVIQSHCCMSFAAAEGSTMPPGGTGLDVQEGAAQEISGISTPRMTVAA